jgi:hypothetical protein
MAIGATEPLSDALIRLRLGSGADKRRGGLRGQ